MSGYILEAENICKSIGVNEEKLEILNNISLYVKEGEYVAIMGPSGSGKSRVDCSKNIKCYDQIYDIINLKI